MNGEALRWAIFAGVTAAVGALIALVAIYVGEHWDDPKPEKRRK